MALACATGVLLAAAAGASLQAPAADASAAADTASPLPPSEYQTRLACPPPLPGHPSCLASVLVPRTADAASKTPAFKSVLIAVEPASSNSNGVQANGVRGRVPLSLLPR